jgi:4-amino-4-deoxy-L-arabinose transferase-like glycosyltransferase
MIHFTKKQMILILGLGFLAAYLFMRLANIMTLPIFTDEAIYLRWAQIAGNDPDWLFISLTDGKQPLFVWLAMMLMKVIEDPLLAGRLVSVIAGLFSMSGLYLLANEIFKSKKIGFVAAFLYLLYPFALVYDRIALYDSLVAAFIIWALYVEVLLIRQLHIKWAIVLGVVIGIGLLNKTSANFALILLPFSLLLFDFKDKLWKKKLVRWLIYAMIAAFIAQAIYQTLRLSPFFYIIAQKNETFVFSFSEWITHPLTFLIPNLKTLWEWLSVYTTIPVLIFIFISIFIGRKYLNEKLLLFAWFIVPFIALAAFGKLLYPRYILFMTMPLLVLGAFSFYTVVHGLPSRWIKAGIFFVFMLPFIITDMFIITDFPKASIANADLGQYYRGWPAGGGIAETVMLFKKESENKKIHIVTEGTFGLMPYALEIYLHDNPNITIEGLWPVKDEPEKRLLELSKQMPVYMVFYQPRAGTKVSGKARETWPVKQIYQYKKIEPETYLTVYQLLVQ